MNSAVRAPIRCVAADFGGTIAVSHTGTAPSGHVAAGVLRDRFGLSVPESFATVLEDTEREIYREEKPAGTQTGYAGILTIAAARVGAAIEDPVAAAEAVFDAATDARVDPRAAQALKDLAGSGIRIVLASNTRWPGPVRERTLEAAGILDCFSALVLSSELGLAKPHPGFYARVLELADCPPAQVLFVGDTLTKDVNEPRRHGMQAVLITGGESRPAQLPDGIETIVHFADLPELIVGRAR